MKPARLAQLLSLAGAAKTGVSDVVHATMRVTLAAAADDAEPGAVQALVSAYNIVYRVGYWAERQRILPGAFAKAPERIPLFWEHSWVAGGIPIGDGAPSETDDGLEIDGELYIADAEVARIHRALLAGAVAEWSIGYRVLASREVVEDGEEITEVLEGELLEASIVVRGANPGTETHNVASEGTDVAAVLAQLLGVDQARIAAALAAAATPPAPPAPVAAALASLDQDWVREELAALRTSS